MTERRGCVKCGRTIDAYARICPYCNFDQNDPVPASKAAPVEGEPPVYTPPADHRKRKLILSIAGGILGVILAFVIGTRVHGNKPPTTVPGKDLPTTTAAANASQRPHANVTLVPDTGPAPNIEQPITSARGFCPELLNDSNRSRSLRQVPARNRR